MNTATDTIDDIKEDVDHYRERLKDDWQDVRSSIDPRDRLEEAIRHRPKTALGVAAATGLVVGSSILPSSRQSPIGVVLGGMMGFAYRGLLMAAAPVFAQRVTEWASPSHQSHHPNHQLRPGDFPQHVADPSGPATSRHTA